MVRAPRGKSFSESPDGPGAAIVTSAGAAGGSLPVQDEQRSDDRHGEPVSGVDPETDRHPGQQQPETGEETSLLERRALVASIEYGLEDRLDEQLERHAVAIVS